MKSQDPHLSQLRAQIKKVMIPLLIKIFEIKLAGKQAQSLPSRLQKKENTNIDELRAELLSLGEDIHLLHLWCISCQNQIEKALGELQTTDPSLIEKAPRLQGETSTTSHLLLKKFLGQS